MKKIRKMIQAITDPNKSMQERMFRLLVASGLLGLALGIIIGIISGEHSVNLVFLIVAFVLLILVTGISVHYQKIQAGAVAIAAMLIFVVLPYNFLTGGGIYGGGPIWFLFGVVFVCMVVEKRIKYFLIVSGFLVQSVCFYVAYFYPELVSEHTAGVAHIDSYSTLLIVTVLISSMILFQNSIYRKENEKAKKQKKEIEELNRTQNRFFSSMSHEIRTPINTIIGLNEMILREDVSDEVAEDAKNIQGASKMLLALINDILDMSKIESGKMDIVPVEYNTGDMLSDVVNMIWIRAKQKKLEFHVDVDKETPSRLFGDEVRIKQILINLLNNAVKYTSEGTVTLSIQCDKITDGMAYVSYSVSDTGMGIKKENIPHLFNAFRRVDQENNRHIEGTGLGLSIVKQLIELMGGEVTVNSVYTKGSTFMVTIPQKVVNASEIGELDLESKRSVGAREVYIQSFEAPEAHVLIVDDNMTNLMVEEKLLRDTKVNVDTAGSGAECLKKTLENRYDVILMDHLMPEMDGIECLHLIRSQSGGLNYNTPVVVLTANAGGEHRALYAREGFDGYLLKPVGSKDLEKELLRHLPKELIKLGEAFEIVGNQQAPVLAHRRRKPLIISTESTADIPKELIEKYQISIMPFRVRTDGGEFLDELETATDGIMAYISSGEKSAVSAAPETKDYEEYFAELLTKAQHIIHISLAKNVSNAYKNATEASKVFDNVSVVDSGQLSSGVGLMVLHAVECIDAGMRNDEILVELGIVKKKIKTSFIVTDTEYLTRAGRIPERVHAICKAFLIHPVISLKNSAMGVGSLRIGTTDVAARKYINAALKFPARIDKKLLFITYVGLSRDELENIKEQVNAKVKFEKIITQKASSAIATNCGPGTFGLLYRLKYDKNE